MSHQNVCPPAELEARLRLHYLPGLGPARFRKLIQAFGGASSALTAPARAWCALGMPEHCAGLRRDRSVAGYADEALRWLDIQKNQVLMWDDPSYPGLLAELPDAPPLLYLQGEAGILECPQLAIVGSRRASRPGLENARRFATHLAAGGFVITSGLALGIDGAAHQGALDVAGFTVAVLGTGLQRLYPRAHECLARDIVERGGVLVSELPLDAPPQSRNFPRRNRIISGLSLGVLVIEASLSSGSLITARLAAEQGREVYALPGSIHHPGARGCHRLIREGAALVETTDDILQALSGWLPRAVPDESAPESAVTSHPLLALLHAAPQTTDALVVSSGWPLHRVLAALTELELSGDVVCDAGFWLGCKG